VQTEQPHLLIFPFIGGQFRSFTVEDKTVCAIPALCHVETFMDFPAQFLRGYVTTEKDGLYGARQRFLHFEAIRLNTSEAGTKCRLG
jgi:hypothetical protein